MAGMLVVFGIMFSLLAWLQQSRARKAANNDRETAIKETSARVATETADRVTKAMTTQYEGTISGLNQQIGALQTGLSAMDKASMDRSNRIAAGVDDAVKMQTGGDSFAFVTLTAEPAQAFEMHWNNFLAPKGQPYFVVSVTSHGKYPLRDTHAIMMDDERRLAAMQEYNTHTRTGTG